MAQHPIHRFDAPKSIQTGTPLKEIINEHLVRLIGESLTEVYPDFDLDSFEHQAIRNLNILELKDRAKHIAGAMAAQLPNRFDETAEILISSLGPELRTTENYGLQPFFYLPHAELIAQNYRNNFTSGMRANYELTKRFTAEFSIRTYIIEYPRQALDLLEKWCDDANPHVRRLVSEGSRPRLPWAMRLKEIDKKPNLTLPLLEKLKDDSELYVRRSVANHLGDLAKDNLETILETCGRWLNESDSLDEKGCKNRRWIIRHALRHPAKKNVQAAKELRLAAK